MRPHLMLFFSHSLNLLILLKKNIWQMWKASAVEWVCESESWSKASLWKWKLKQSEFVIVKVEAKRVCESESWSREWLWKWKLNQREILWTWIVGNWRPCRTCAKHPTNSSIFPLNPPQDPPNVRKRETFQSSQNWNLQNIYNPPPAEKGRLDLNFPNN